MRAASLFHGSRSERTFALGLSLLAAVAVTQLVAALVIYLQRTQESRAVTMPVPTSPGAVGVSSRVAPATTSSVAPTAGRLTKTRSKARGAVPYASVSDELLQVAKALRLHGDTANAIAKLQQATTLDPKNAEVLAELAMTYESMQLFDRSNETWRRLQALGAAAGPLAELAELKLREGVPVQGIPGSTGRSPTDAAAPNDASTIPDGSTFGISQVTQTNIADPDAVTHLTLRVGVKRRPNVQVDFSKVKIQVFFYDVVNNEQVLLTDAEVSYDWVTPAHNWVDTDTEILEVTYLRRKKHYPVPGAALAPVPDSVEKAEREAKKKNSEEAAPTEDEGQRQYLGYIVRVYYKDELQAVRADPTRLLNLFPPPFTAPPE